MSSPLLGRWLHGSVSNYPRCPPMSVGVINRFMDRHALPNWRHQ